MKYALTLLLLIASLNSQAMGKIEKEPLSQAIMGISTYGGMTFSDEEQGYFAGASLYMFFFNWALEAKSFPSDRIIKPYMGLGLGRFLQVQQEIDFTGKFSFRVVSEIAFDELIDKRNHWTLHLSAERLDTDDKDDMRYGLGLGYTF